MNHWAFEAVIRGSNNGLLPGMGLLRDPLRSMKQGRPVTRGDAAQVFWREFVVYDLLQKDFESQSAKVRHGTGPIDKDDKELLRWEVQAVRSQVFSQIGNDLCRASVEFAAELNAMHRRPGEIVVIVDRLRSAAANARMPAPGSALKQFSDVPSNHWAARDVLELRRLGLVDGYPDDRFAG